MRTAKLLSSVPWFLLVLAGAACSDDAPGESETGSTGPSGATFTSTTGPSSGTLSGTTSGADTSSAGSGDTETAPSTTEDTQDDTGTGGESGGSGETSDEGLSSTGGVPSDPFMFRQEDPSEYTRVDRVGFPGIQQILIRDQVAYNAGDPASDGNNVRTEMSLQLNDLMLGTMANEENGIYDDIVRAGFTPCVPPGSPDAPFRPERVCFSQFLLYILPDVLLLDLDEPTAFPNGRTLEDPAMDFVFALFTLNIDERLFGAEIDDQNVDRTAHSLDAYYDLGGGISLTTPGNDVPYNENRFFRLADPH